MRRELLALLILVPACGSDPDREPVRDAGTDSTITEDSGLDAQDAGLGTDAMVCPGAKQTNICDPTTVPGCSGQAYACAGGACPVGVDSGTCTLVSSEPTPNAGVYVVCCEHRVCVQTISENPNCEARDAGVGWTCPSGATTPTGCIDVRGNSTERLVCCRP